MDKDKMNERLLKTSVWMRSNNFYIRMKAELLQVFLRKELLNIEMMSTSRAYTKKEMANMRKQHNAMWVYFNVLLKRCYNIWADFDFKQILTELDEVELC